MWYKIKKKLIICEHLVIYKIHYLTYQDITVGKWGVSITLVMKNQTDPIIIPNNAPNNTCFQVWYWR